MNTPSIILRQWKDSDLAAFAEMNADPEVMRYFVRPRNAEESKADLARFRSLMDERGWGLWAVEVDGVCAGFTATFAPQGLSLHIKIQTIALNGTSTHLNVLTGGTAGESITMGGTGGAPKIKFTPHRN